MYNCYGSNPTIINCVFSNNSVQRAGIGGRGGGICNRTESSPMITGCTFSGNWAKYRGGGIGNFEQCSPRIVDCTFTGNSAGEGGGAICNYSDSNPIITNCIFSGNIADSYGGAMKNYESSPLVTNCTFADNRADRLCGGIWDEASGGMRLTNCILWGNRDDTGGGEAAQIAVDGDEVSVSYCCIEGWSGVLGGPGNFGLDPLFVDPKNGDYHLKSQGWRWDRDRNRWDYDEVTSPCIDAGNPGMLTREEPITVPEDPDNDWGVNIRIDMGAYGGTAEASMAPYGWALLADLTNDGVANLWDFAVEALKWSVMGVGVESDLDRNGVVNAADLAKFAEDWLKFVRVQLGQ